MGDRQNKNLIGKTGVICMVMLCCICGVEGARLLEAERQQWVEQKVQILAIVQRLQRGPVPPSGRSPCTYIPGQSRGGRCTLGQRTYAVHHHNLSPPPPPPPPPHSDSNASQ
uniref:Uncharacterized protein n=1 Tax=Kalanchoe fedtschenkoi TaxID=63787 RepID=A0A7N0SY69_KALFE